MRNQYQLSDEEDPKVLSELTAGTSEQRPPVAVAPPAPQTINQDGKQYDFMPGQNGSLTVKGAPAAPAPLLPPLSPTPAKSVALPGMPASVMPDDIAGYLGKQKQQINRFGPEEQLALQNSLDARQNSLGNRATEGLKGFGDAIMMGVARAGNPGWQSQYENQERQNAQDQMNTFRGAGETNLKQVESNMSLDKMNPKSALSKAAQENYAPLFQKLGYQPAKLQGMSAASIDNALGLMAQFGGKEVEAKIKEYELEIEKMRLAGALSHQSAEEKIAEDTNKRQSLETLSKMPWYSRILHPGISGSLEKQAGIDAGTSAVPEFKTEEEAAAAGLDDGAPVVIGGVSGKWRKE